MDKIIPWGPRIPDKPKEPPKGISLIYGLHCVPTQQWYVGQTTVSILDRWRSHRQNVDSGVTTPLAQSIRLHGMDAFDLYELMRLPALGADTAEAAAIQMMGSHQSVGGLNYTWGAWDSLMYYQEMRGASLDGGILRNKQYLNWVFSCQI